MSKKEIYIKNMVCPRCSSSVQKVLEKLSIPFERIELGKVDLKEPIIPSDKLQLATGLKELGFELLEIGKSAIISKIKSLVIQQIHYQDEPMNENFSTLLSSHLNHEYSYLSRLFSSVEGLTIEKYITKQKIEKVKELIFYDELSLKEIAFRLSYSSTAYLSTQFKKETGMTPTEFKKAHQPGHRSLDSL